MAETFSFGAWVRKRRRALDLTQDELAQRIGCAVSMVRKIELDERRPSKQLAALLADSLELHETDRAAFLKAARAELLVEQIAAPIAPIAPDLALIGQPPAKPPPHLPAATTTLIGRSQDLASLHALAARPHVRLITLTGPGGTGKTRLALQSAAELANSYPAGVVFVDLAPLAMVDQVIPTIAQLLGVRELVGMTLIERLREYLQPLQMLLLLDNFEHLLDAAPLVADLLRSAPKLMVLVTSRVVLHLSGEHEYPVPPLAVPPPIATAVAVGALGGSTPTSDAAIAVYPAVQLFAERAQAAQPTFALTERNALAVAEICRRLDGLPLAIELAAARIKVFTAEALLARLGDRLRLLIGGARDLPARQQALRTTIDWSYQLLNQAEQQLFRRLAVFVGGWTLEAAEAICNNNGDLGIELFDGLQTLVDHSLVRQEHGPDGSARFKRLETIGEYAHELLAASGEQSAFQQRHAEYFCALAEEAETYNYQPTEAFWHRRLASDYDNLQAALAWAAGKTGEPTIALRLAAALLLFWVNAHPLSEGFRWLGTALAASNETVLPALRAKAICTAGNIALFKGDFRQAEPLLIQALRSYESLGDDRGCSDALNLLGILKRLTGHLAESLHLEEASLQRAHIAQSEERAAWALVAFAHTHQLCGDYDLAVQIYEECLASEVLQSRASHYHICSKLAESLYYRGEEARAMELLEESVRNLQAEGTLMFISIALLDQASIAQEYGAFDQADQLLQENLQIAYHTNRATILPQIHYQLGLLALKRGDLTPSHQHFQQSLTFFRILENPWRLAVVLLGTGLTALLLEDRPLAAQHYTESITLLHEWRENMLARQAALLVALTGVLLASVFDSTAMATQATQIWSAITLLEPLTAGKRVTPPFLSLPRPSDALRTADLLLLHTTLGAEAFDSAWAQGKALTLEQAVDVVLEWV